MPVLIFNKVGELGWPSFYIWQNLSIYTPKKHDFNVVLVSYDKQNLAFVLLYHWI